MKSIFTLLIAAFCLSATATAQGFGFTTQNPAIPDAGCGSNEMVATCQVRDVGKLDFGSGNNVGYIFLNIDHPYTGDLRIRLTSPEGTTVVLSDRNGGSGDDYTNTSFVSWNVNNPISSGTAPFSGSYEPEDPLSNFDGEWANGLWTLTVCDDAGSDVGTFLSCSIWFSVNANGARKFLSTDFTNGSRLNWGEGGGTFSGSPAFLVDDHLGQTSAAYQLNGSNAMELSTDNGTLNPTNAISLAAWIKPGSATGIQCVLGKGNASIDDLYMMGLSNGEFYAEVKVNGAIYTAKGGTVTAGRWYHLAFTYETGGLLRLYLDGVQVASANAASQAMNSLTNAEPWRIGAAPWSSTVWTYNGVVDHIGGWSYALSTDGVRNHMAASNSHCRDAVELPVTGNSCTANRAGQNYYAPTFNNGGSPSCANYAGGGVWYRVTVPASGAIAVETEPASNQAALTDTGMEIYSGDCDNLTALDCNDDAGTGNHSKLVLTNQTPGAVLYVRIWEYGNNQDGFFSICAYDPPLVAVEEAVEGLQVEVYPNPTADRVRVSVSNQQGEARADLYSLQGQHLGQFDLESGSAEVDLSSYASGVYLLRVTTADQSFLQKIVRR